VSPAVRAGVVGGADGGGCGDVREKGGCGAGQGSARERRRAGRGGRGGDVGAGGFGNHRARWPATVGGAEVCALAREREGEGADGRGPRGGESRGAEWAGGEKRKGRLIGPWPAAGPRIKKEEGDGKRTGPRI
jgi:hypothetical protein